MYILIITIMVCWTTCSVSHTETRYASAEQCQRVLAETQKQVKEIGQERSFIKGTCMPGGN